MLQTFLKFHSINELQQTLMLQGHPQSSLQQSFSTSKLFDQKRLYYFTQPGSLVFQDITQSLKPHSNRAEDNSSGRIMETNPPQIR